jgi:hypothetical protein
MKKALRLFLFGIASFIVIFAVFLALNWRKLTDQIPNFLLIEPTFRVHLCEGSSAKSPKILFVGNSLTFINMIPWLVADFSTKLRHDTPDVYQLLKPGANLETHDRLGHFKKLVENQKFDYVVIQEQTGRSLDEPAEVEKWLKRSAETAKISGARVIVFEPWVNRIFSDEQSLIHQNFEQANKRLGLTLAPVGDAFFDERTEKTKLKVYAEDDHHASASGSYLAACILYETIFGSNCAGAPSSVSVKGAYNLDVPLVQLSKEQAASLQTVAHQIVEEQKKRSDSAASSSGSVPSPATTNSSSSSSSAQ